MSINRYSPLWTQAVASALNALLVLDYDRGVLTNEPSRAVRACDEADAVWLEMQRREQADIDDAALKDGGRP